MKIVRRLVPLFGRPFDRRGEASIAEDLGYIEQALRKAIEGSSASRSRLESLCDRGYSVYMIHEIAIGLYPSNAADPTAVSTKPPLLYRALSYGEAGANGEVALTPTRTSTLHHCESAPEFIERRMGLLARCFALPCGFCGHKVITLWMRLQTRYDKRPRHCPACQRPYTLDIAAVKRFTTPVVAVMVLTCCWLSGRMDSLSPLVLAMLLLVTVEATLIVTAPQRSR